MPSWKAFVIKIEWNFQKTEKINFFSKMFGETFFYLIGIYTFLWWFIDNFKSLFQILWHLLVSYIQPNANLPLNEKFGTWAGELMKWFDRVLCHTTTTTTTTEWCQASGHKTRSVNRLETMPIYRNVVILRWILFEFRINIVTFFVKRSN